MNWVLYGLNQFWELLFPRLCIVCEDKLIASEKYLCLSCLLHLPVTDHLKTTDNIMEQLFYGRVQVERACAYFEFKKGSRYKQLLHELKYRNQKELGDFLGQKFGALCRSDETLMSADYICPVPLHPRKERKRGYNQSYHFARGIGDSMNIPVQTDNLYRQHYTDTQTRKSRWNRWKNVEGIFALKNPELFRGKHVIIVDDVVTTGATLEACISAIQQSEGVRVSVLTMAIA